MEGVATTRFLDPPKSSEHRKREVGMVLRSDEMAHLRYSRTDWPFFSEHFHHRRIRNSLVGFSLRCLQSGSDYVAVSCPFMK